MSQSHEKPLEDASYRCGAAGATFAAFSANLAGIGLARFGYTPLIPALIASHWFAPAAAVYLGAANLAGYLAGALGARAMAAQAGPIATLRAMMTLTAISLIACAWPLGFWWFFLWRFLSGLAGGALMALAAPAVLPHIERRRRGLAGGVIFTGVGLGIAASGTLVPLLLEAGLRAAWIGLGLMALLLTAMSWRGWPRRVDVLPLTSSRRQLPPQIRRSLAALYIAYALNAMGLVPHMVFLVDFVARGLNLGLAAGARCWVMFGIGALVGPLAAGYLGDRLGFARTLRLAFILETLCIGLPAFLIGTPALMLSSFFVGAFVPGIVAIVIGRMRELLPGNQPAQAVAWSFCTTAFALGQTVAGYGFSYIFAHAQNTYSALFELGAAALVGALAVDVLTAARDRGNVVP